MSYFSYRNALLLATAFLLVCAWTVAEAQTFQLGQGATSTLRGQRDRSGVALRGRIARTYTPPSSLTLFRGQAQVGGTCGALDFGTQLSEYIDEIPDLLSNIANQALAGLPMAVICYAEPGLCDLYKFFQSFGNVLLQGRTATCQSVQNAMAGVGLRVRGGEQANCVERRMREGASQSEAWDDCVENVINLRLPNGTLGQTYELYSTVLDAAGASPGTIASAAGILGNMTFTTGGSGMSITANQPNKTLRGRYEDIYLTTASVVQQAVTDHDTTGTVPLDVLQQLNVPGWPFPIASVEHLASLQGDPVRYNTFLESVASKFSMVQLAHEVYDLEDSLEGATSINPHISDEARAIITRRLESLSRELDRFRKEQEIHDQMMIPILQALAAESTTVKSQAIAVGMQARSFEPRPMPLGSQTSIGYSY